MHHDDSHSAGHHSTHHDVMEAQATAGGHGQLVFGQETIYFSHLPMFMFDEARHPHNFQVILEVKLSKPGNDPQALYLRDRQQTGQKLYTFFPDTFSMSDLASPDTGHPRLQELDGDLYHNHFEREGRRRLVTGVTATIEKVVYFQQFQRHAEPLPQLEYLLFGRGGELFLAHVITRPPDFDQVLSVTLDGHQFSEEQLRGGLHVSFPGRENTIPQSLKEGERLIGQIHLNGDCAPETRELELAVGTEFYFESRELAREM
jgi:hypothetical protein